MHLAMAPVLLGDGEHLFAGINLPRIGFLVEKTVAGEKAGHVVIENKWLPAWVFTAHRSFTMSPL